MDGFFNAVGAAANDIKPRLENAAGAFEGAGQSVAQAGHELGDNFNNAVAGTADDLKPHAEYTAEVAESIGQAAVEAGHEHAEKFSNAAAGTFNNLNAKLAETLSLINDHARSAVEEAEKRLAEFDAGAAMEEIKEKLQLAGLKLEELAQAALKFAEQKPGVIVMLTIAPLILIYPSLAWGPVLHLLGLTVGGPAAGGIFASLQSRFGTPGAMRTFQSAAMGGTGSLVMDIAVRGVVALAVGAIVVQRLVAFKESCDKQEQEKCEKDKKED
ncbi:unnamed protein product [Cercospora beticola]|nr:unnamed protein product [Cercospora beticola]